jgi:stage VI sporulation protein D
MSKEKYSPIKFQLEESIWLDHHANDAEIISLELEPQIEVEEERNFITITGSLALTGRFAANEEEGEESLDLESSSLADQLHFQPFRVDQREIVEEDFRGKIEKRFPIDVTIPANKIDDIEDVFVQIEQFDYNVTNGHRLNITADITISGIRNEARVEESEQVEVEQKKLNETRVEDTNFKKQDQGLLFPTFDVAASKDELSGYDEKREDSEEEPSAEVEEPTEERQFDQVSEEEVSEADVSEPVSEDQRVSSKEVSRVDDSTESDELSFATSALDEDEREEESDNVVPLFDNEIRTLFRSQPSSDENQDVDDEVRVEDAVESKTTSFLTQLMSGRDEEVEQTTKLRMCILQREETLETISERYEIPVRDILRVNRMESEQVTAGQILYIPKS